MAGLKGLSSEVSIFAEVSPLAGVYGDTDEAQFLLSALWDKIKTVKTQMPLRSIAQGLEGIIFLKDPISANIRNYLQAQAIRLGAEYNHGESVRNDADIISAVRALRLNNLQVPKWLAELYIPLEEAHSSKPVLSQSRGDKLITQRLALKFPDVKFVTNSIIDGVQLDLDFKELALNIEVDSVNHQYPAQRRNDLSRDEFLRVTKKYEVIRIETMGQNVDQIVDKIEKIYRKKADVAAMTEIQKMYSRAEEEKIQNM